MQGNIPESSGAGARPTRQAHTRANTILLKIAGRSRAWSALTHFGRNSGRAYLTPLTAYPLGDGFVLALLYGEADSVDWCRNVMSAGRCILKTAGQEYELERPEILSASQAWEAYPPLFRLVYKLQGTSEFLWAHQKRT
jgi:hypothetical protein